MAGVLGILTDPASTAHAIEKLQEAGFKDIEAYSPCPSHEIEHALDKGPSSVRGWTLVGCLIGVTVGFAVPIAMAYDYPLVVGGKPFASIPAYTVIGFELNILVGVLLTVAGLMFHGIYRTRKDAGVYRPSFSNDEFGCLVSCAAGDIERVTVLLKGAGCTEVRVLAAA
jgi:hypothetical protein